MTAAHKLLAIVLGEAVLAAVIAYQLWTKGLPVEAYLVAAGGLGILVGFALWTYQTSRGFVFIQVLFVGFIVMSVYYLATHYTVLPWGDAYHQYWVLGTFMEQGQMPLTPQTDRPWGVPGFYLGWPGIHALGVTIGRTLDVSPLAVAMFLPWILFLMLFLFAYLLLKGVVDDLGLQRGTLGLGMLIFVTSPFIGAGGFPPGYEYQYLGASLITMLFYLSHRRLGRSTPALSLVLLLTIASVIIIHHYTSVLAALYLVSVATVFLVVQTFSVRSNRRSYGESNLYVRSFFVPAALALVLMFLWWDEVSTSIWPVIGSAFERIAEIARRGSAEAAVWKSLYPYPSPLWMIAVMWARTILVFGAAALGLMVILRQGWATQRTQVFILGSFAALSAPILLDLAFGFVGAPYRAVGLFMPFFALSAALFFARLRPSLGKLRSASGAIVPIVSAILIFVALVGQWGHRAAPRHLYDPSVSSTLAGEHPLGWRRLDQFLDSALTYENVETFVTDESYTMDLILPFDQWRKVAVVGTRRADLGPGSMVVAFRGLSTDSYIVQEIRPAFLQPDFDSGRFQRQVESDLNRIYDDGEFQVWQNRETQSY